MKTKVLFSILLLILPALFVQVKAQDNNPKKENENWYKKKEWLGGLKLQPYSGMDVQEFARQYKANKKYFDEAFAFLRDHDLSKLAPGKYPIDGDNVYASVTYDSTKDFDKSKWESHKKYIDLQYMIRGKEKIGVAPVAGAKVTAAYDDAHDIAHYETNGHFYVAEPGTFFLFFPADAHRPDLKEKTNDHVKKLVIKIGVAK